MTDARRQALQDWVIARLHDKEVTGELVVVSGDASFRRYFRLPVTGKAASLIAVDAPPEKEDSWPFVAIARALSAHGVAVPQVLAADFDQGFMLLEDFGDVLLRPRLAPDTVEGLYTQAMQTLRHMLTCREVPDYSLPLYDRSRLITEMELLREWFVGRYLELTLSEQQHELLTQAFVAITDAVLQQPQVFVHRDYHSRNLMLLEDGRMGVIDFQDAVVGPITYDLVSLLRDAYVEWPADSVKKWVNQFAAVMREDGLLHVDDATFLKWFDWMGAQRHLKVVGIFARLSIRDGKHGYLDDIPLVFDYLLAEIRHYPELSVLSDFLRNELLPLYLQKKPAAEARLAHWLNG